MQLNQQSLSLDILCVQEVVTHLYSNLLYKMGHYFLDIQYIYINLQNTGLI